jgi:hypothetical protein
MKTKDIPFTELRVGGKYCNRNGNSRKIVDQDKTLGKFQFCDSDGNYYAIDGQSMNEARYDLIAEIVPDDEPEPHASRATDLINHPPHYTRGKMECIQIIEAMLTPEEFRGYLKGSAIKYTYRDGSKGGENTRQSDSAKAEWYASCRADFDRRRNV